MAPVPITSPTQHPSNIPGTPSRRKRIQTKVLEELKQATGRKGAITPPPPLSLNDLPNVDTVASGASTPIETTAHGKVKACGLCERSFTVFRAKHTCKLCLARVCDDCSRNRMKLNRRLERRKGSRLCNPCARNNMDVLTVTSPSTTATRENEIVPSCSLRTSTVPLPSASIAESVNGSSGTAIQGRRPDNGNAALRYSNVIAMKTHLRTRHWLSFGVWVCLLLLKLFHFNSPYVRSKESLWMMSVSSAVDQVVSLRVLTSHLLGLILYDEVLTRTQRRQRKTSRPRIGEGTIIPPMKQKVSRTRSGAMSDPGGILRARIPSTVVERREDDEVIEVEVGDRVPEEETEGFRFDKMLLLLHNCTSTNRVIGTDGQPSQLRMSSFLAMSDTICGFINCFGRATSFAASTVSGYIGTIGTNLAGWPVPSTSSPLLVDGTEFSWKEQSVQSVIEREVELQIASSGGKKKPSCARCVLRLVWFAEFVEACIRYALIENKEENCSSAASKAYEETIGSRHPWIIRKGVMSAMSSLPTRSAIIQSLKLHEFPPEEVEAQLMDAQVQMKTMLHELMELLGEYNLMDIK